MADDSLDELGELARAFDRMRLRLAQLDDARREFIANASHELRTPLFSLGGFLELMDDEDLDEDTRAEFLAAMREQVARLTRLATDLLDLSRLDAGRIRIERQEFDLEPLAHTVADEFSPVALANDHSLEVVSGNGSVPALGDPERVLQIGRLLVENAIVHTPPGTPVRLRVYDGDGRAVLSVEDQGPGIPEGAGEQVFERFYRAEGGRSSGSGLGLAIARELAVLMGGTIEVDSRPGRTVFSLALPVPEEPGTQEGKDEKSPARASTWNIVDKVDNRSDGTLDTRVPATFSKCPAQLFTLSSRSPERSRAPRSCSESARQPAGSTPVRRPS